MKIQKRYEDYTGRLQSGLDSECSITFVADDEDIDNVSFENSQRNWLILFWRISNNLKAKMLLVPEVSDLISEKKLVQWTEW